MNEKIRKAFRASSFRYGTYSLILTGIVLAIVIAVNLILGQLPSGMKNIDISEQKLYSVGDVTVDQVSALTEDVQIYSLAVSGSEDEVLQQLVRHYADLSDHVTCEMVDPNVRPDLLKTYEISSEDLTSGGNDILVVSEKRHKLITYSDMYEAVQDSIYNYYMYGTPVEYNFDGEGEITSAISYVTTDNIPKMYLLSGHDEEKLGSRVSSLIEKNSIAIEELNLTTNPEVPEDCSILAIIKPSRDLTEAEVEVIENYITYGGNCVIVNNVNMQEKLTNYSSLLRYYGVTIPAGYVFETTGRCNYPYRWYLYEPCEADHSIVSDFGSQSAVYTTYAQPILQNPDKRKTLEVEAFLTSSEGSWLRTDMDSDVLDEKIESDVDGPFDLAVTITDTSQYGTGKLVLYATYDFINDETIAAVPSAVNADVFVRSLRYLSNVNSYLNIPIKSATVQRNSVTVAQFRYSIVIFVIVLPLVVLVFGFGVWIRRRRR